MTSLDISYKLDLLLEVLWESGRALIKLQRPRGLLSGDTTEGTCPICERRTLFIKSEPWLREDYRCVRCGSIARWRALYHVLATRFPDWRSRRIHEASPFGPGSRKIRRSCRDYVASTFSRRRMPPGMLRVDLADQRFPDEHFDLVITQDILEHVLDPKIAVREIARTIKKGGAHLFTVPWNKAINTSVRAVCRSGVVELLKDPVYHGDAYNPKGSLVVTDWGADMIRIIEQSSGMRTELISLQDPSIGTDAEMVDVFISFKR